MTGSVQHGVTDPIRPSRNAAGRTANPASPPASVLRIQASMPAS